jgi:hypothetical protein
MPDDKQYPNPHLKLLNIFNRKLTTPELVSSSQGV